MNVRAKKLELMQLLLDTDDENLLSSLKEVFVRDEGQEALAQKSGGKCFKK